MIFACEFSSSRIFLGKYAKMYFRFFVIIIKSKASNGKYPMHLDTSIFSMEWISIVVSLRNGDNTLIMIFVSSIIISVNV